MANINFETIKNLRIQTGAGVMEIKKALEEAAGNSEAARLILKKKGLVKAEKKSNRVTKSGLIYSYIHGEGQIGLLIELNCETDFVAKTDEFKNLAHELSLQITSMNPESLDDLLHQDYIRNPKLKIEELVKEVVAKTGENVTIRRFTRYQLGN